MQPPANPYRSPGEQPQQGPEAAAASRIRDQSTGLVVFGIFQILIGCFCLLMVPLMLLVATMPQPGMPPGRAPTAAMMVPAAGFYLPSAVLAISLGVGSDPRRRSARTLTVVLSWLWLVMGWPAWRRGVFMMPRTLASMPQNVKLPPQGLVMIQAVTGGMLTCVYILLPLVYLLFYQRASVRATCEWRDPQVRWTDRCPMPVLAVSILLAFGLISMTPLVAYGFLMPFFGVCSPAFPGRSSCCCGCRRLAIWPGGRIG